ncbi:hypothetical protein D3C87_2006110 [compost metagenome]
MITRKNVTPMIGIMARIASASFQLMVNNKTVAPIIINTEDVMETMAWDMNTLIESTSAVRLVRSLDGFACSI